MNISEFKNERYLENRSYAIENIENFINLLKTMSRNYDYCFRNQLNINYIMKDNTFVTSRERWKILGREVINKTVAIETLQKNEEKEEYIVEVFDISQTKENKETNEIIRKLTIDRYNISLDYVLSNFLEKNNAEEFLDKTNSSKFFQAVSLAIYKTIDKLLEDLVVKKIKVGLTKEKIVVFLQECLSIILSEKFGLKYKINEETLDKTLKTLRTSNKYALLFLGEFLGQISKYTIEEFLKINKNYNKNKIQKHTEEDKNEMKKFEQEDNKSNFEEVIIETKKVEIDNRDEDKEDIKVNSFTKDEVLEKREDTEQAPVTISDQNKKENETNLYMLVENIDKKLEILLKMLNEIISNDRYKQIREVDKLLNAKSFEGKEIPLIQKNKSKKLQYKNTIEEAILNYCKNVLDEDYDLESLEKNNISLGCVEFEGGFYGEIILDLEDYTYSLLIDEKIVAIIKLESEIKGDSELSKEEYLINDLKKANLERYFTRIDKETLFKHTGFKKDAHGNYYRTKE
ncbi:MULTISPECIES: hypothetical protein [unclassified Gemella]|uniref:hypothetical protein n=1 Tax=unclassified Gemella TaxID=2624949 RepID=UPI00107393D0|nr:MULTISPECIES: hypothetical protein [unclassified Gemella]MBF0710561.1 hypothetical protein [Gemella sp. GL1.1]MBF0746460.1 hypothetical protein [Gemella sp. 19428wG2_WT2a]NYS27905.1 hypothetical protein [Gemella sp. GL1]TFU60241.1 hypothetical protein E4T67_02025 [Gemella sp. WT2a]